MSHVVTFDIFLYHKTYLFVSFLEVPCFVLEFKSLLGHHTFAPSRVSYSSTTIRSMDGHHIHSL